MGMWQGSLILLSTCMVVVDSRSERVGCQPTEFRCESGQCVNGGRYCDGNHDCFDGTDEPEQCTNCNRSYYGLVGVKYPLRLSDRRTPTCTLTFVAAGGKNGNRVEITFLSFQIGIYDFDSSSCLRGYMEVEDSRPVNPRKRSARFRRRTNKKGTVRRKGDPLLSLSGSFCGALIGKSATFYSTGDQVKLTVFVPPHGAAGQPTAPRLYLTYRFLELKSPAERSFLNGNVNRGAKCDAVLTNCHFQQCVIRSPNYPGFYLRNTSCFYWVKEDSAPPGKVTQIEVYQINEFKINIPSGHMNTDRYKPGTLTSDCAGDTVRIYDGRTTDSSLLAEFCGAGPLPPVRSSGPDILVQLVSVPSQPLSNSHFELAVRIHYVRYFAAHHSLSDGCSVTVDGGRYPSGILKAPDYSLSSGSTCTYRVVGKKSTDRVWFYFSSYHVPDLHPWSEDERCDVGKLEIIHSAPKVRHSHHQQLRADPEAPDRAATEAYCEKRSPRQCGHASDFPDLVPSRPCSVPNESYLTAGPELLFKMSYLSPLSVRGTEPYFTVRYEIVDTDNARHDEDHKSCLVVINGRDKPVGVLESPRNVFLYGRGGSRDLSCKYFLEGSPGQRVVITVEHVQFSNSTLCETVYEPTGQRHDCKMQQVSKFAAINATEVWQDFQVHVGCVCDSQSGVTMESVGYNVQVEFLVRDMGPREDFRMFSFRLLYEFVPAVSACDGRDLVMSGSKGSLRLSVESQDRLPYRCRWLMVALPSRALYVSVGGTPISPECRNKILFYSAGSLKPHAAFCASSGDTVETFFTEAWNSDSHRHYEADITFLEFLVSEPGYLKLSWIEVIWPGNGYCPVECPELEACVGEELACDGTHDCPVTANDESPDKCVTFPFTVVAIFSSTAVALVTIIIVLLVVRYRLKNSVSKSVIPSPKIHRKNGKQSSLSKRPMR